MLRWLSLALSFAINAATTEPNREDDTSLTQSMNTPARKWRTPLRKFAKGEFPPRMKNPPHEDMVIVTNKHRNIADKFRDEIASRFDRHDACKYTHNFTDGSPARTTMEDKRFLKKTEKELGLLYNATPFKDRISIYRLGSPGLNATGSGMGLAERDRVLKRWVSQEWHIDNFHNDPFKILIYLTDVTVATAPFEHIDPVIWRNVGINRFVGRRQRIPKKSRKVVGKAGTAVIFKNSNLPHKGNYPDYGHRDVLSFQFKARS